MRSKIESLCSHTALASGICALVACGTGWAEAVQAVGLGAWVLLFMGAMALGGFVAASNKGVGQ